MLADLYQNETYPDAFDIYGLLLQSELRYTIAGWDANVTTGLFPGAYSNVSNDIGPALGAICRAFLDAISPPQAGGNGFIRSKASIAGSAPTLPIQASQTFLLADVNGDGIPDRVYPSANGIQVDVMAADGSVQSTTAFATGFTLDLALSKIVAADFNGDGNLDLAISNPGNPYSDPGGVVILLGNGDGTFEPGQTITAGQYPSPLAAADFNGDGKIDLAAAASTIPLGGVAEITVLPGNGDGTFGAPTTYASGGDSQAIACRPKYVRKSRNSPGQARLKIR